MKKSILTISLVLVSLFVTSSYGQIHIITNDTTGLTLTWDHSGLDINGKTEHIIRYDIYQNKNDEGYVLIGMTPKDSVNYNPVKSYQVTDLEANSKYEFGVVAVDWAFNESEMHKSIDVTAAYGGWYIILDVTPPRKSSGLDSQ